MFISEKIVFLSKILCKNMKRYIFLLMGFLWGIVSAFSSSLHFRSLKTILPLPTNEVRNLCQDSEGYIWIATYSGLLRYDGYSTIMYRPDAKNRDHSIDGFVNIVREDKNVICGLVPIMGCTCSTSVKIR